MYIAHTQICRKFNTNVPHIHNIASQTIVKFILRLSKSPINEYIDYFGVQ